MDGLDVTGCVDVRAANVRIRRTRITCSEGPAAIRQAEGASGLVVEDSELRGGPSGGADLGIVSTGPFTLLRSEVSGVRNS